MTSDELDLLVKRTLNRTTATATDVEGLRDSLVAKDDQIAALQQINAIQERRIETQRETIEAQRATIVTLRGTAEIDRETIHKLMSALSPKPQAESRE